MAQTHGHPSGNIVRPTADHLEAVQAAPVAEGPAPAATLAVAHVDSAAQASAVRAHHKRRKIPLAAQHVAKSETNVAAAASASTPAGH
jgi:hypothetical protein